MDIKRVDIQVLRAIAVLLVVFYHADLFPVAGGYLGVDVFFVISGYLVTGVIFREMNAGRFSPFGFYLRRAWRLLPAALLTFLIVSLLAVVFLTPPVFTDFVYQLLGSLTFTANVALMFQSGYFEAAAELKPLLHIWSLSLEEQFYFMLPIVLMPFSARWRIWALAALCLLSIALCFYFMEGYASAFGLNSKAAQKLAFFSLPTRMWELLAGAVGACFVVRGLKLEMPTWGKWLALLVIVGAALHPLGDSHPGPDALLVVIATLLLLLGKDGWLPSGMIVSSMVRIGDWSYSLYLIHWPLFSFAFAAYLGMVPGGVQLSLVGLSFVLAALQYRYVEERFRYSYKRYQLGSHPLKQLAFLVVAITLTASPALVAQYWHFNTLNSDSRYVLEPSRGLSSKCKNPVDNMPVIEGCQSRDNPKVLVWGDSYAIHLVEGLVDDDREQLGILQMTKPACSPALGIANTSGRYTEEWSRECIAFNSNVINFAANAPNLRVVVMSSPYMQILGDDGQGLFYGGMRHDFDVRKSTNALIETITRIKALGLIPILVAPPPGDGTNLGECAIRKLTHTLTFKMADCSFLLEDSDRRLQSVKSAMRKIVSQTRVEIFWPEQVLCDDEKCKAMIGENVIYRDRGHLTPFGSRYVMQQLQVMEKIGSLIRSAQ